MILANPITENPQNQGRQPLSACQFGPSGYGFGCLGAVCAAAH